MKTSTHAAMHLSMKRGKIENYHIFSFHMYTIELNLLYCSSLNLFQGFKISFSNLHHNMPNISVVAASTAALIRKCRPH